MVIIIFRCPKDKRLVVVGAGKSCVGKVYIVETQSTGGEISGSFKCLNTCDIRL